MRRTAEDADKTRARVLASAIELFANEGYAAVSADRIARTAGVTRGALHHHFGDKKGVFREAFTAMTKALDAFVRERALTATEPRGAVLAGAAASLEYFARRDYFRIAVVDAPVVLGEAEWHAIDGAVGMRTFQWGLFAMHAAGQLPVMPDAMVAVALFGALTELGFSLARASDQTPARLEEAVAVFTAMLDGLASPGVLSTNPS